MLYFYWYRIYICVSVQSWVGFMKLWYDYPFRRTEVYLYYYKEWKKSINSAVNIKSGPSQAYDAHSYCYCYINPLNRIFLFHGRSLLLLFFIHFASYFEWLTLTVLCLLISDIRIKIHYTQTFIQTNNNNFVISINSSWKNVQLRENFGFSFLLWDQLSLYFFLLYYFCI